MARVLVYFLAAFAALGIVISSSARAAGVLTHRYSFTTDLSDSVGSAGGTATGDASVLGGQLYLNELGSTGARDGRVDLLANGANGININTYPSATIEFWATPECDPGQAGCSVAGAYPNDGFSTAVAFGSVKAAPALGNFPIGAGSDYVIMQTHRGDNVSRGAIAITDETANVGPWTAEDGVNGPEKQDGNPHQYAIVIDSNSLSWYVDGVSQGTTALSASNSHGLANKLASVSNDHVWLGSGYAIDENWAGIMDELRIWKGAASSDYIHNSFAAGPNQLTTFIDKVTVPEPTSFALAVLGACGFAWIRRKARS
jgi:hypothetical protein